jgi:hypothetical protein
MECHFDSSKDEAAPMATPSDRNPPVDWEQKRTEFLNDPKHGLEFFESLNQKIAASVAPGRRTWEEVSATDRFQQAFDYITDRLLTEDGFRNVFEKHRESKSELSLWRFMDTRVSMVLAEWNTKRSEEPTAIVKADEHIEQQGGNDPSVPTERSEIDLNALMQRITRLPQPHVASLLLWLWPLPSFPVSWRETLEPLILNDGERNGLSREEVKRRVDVVMARSKPVLTDEMVEREIRHGLHFEKARLFDRKKRHLFGELQDLHNRGEYSPLSGVEHELRCDCHRSVEKETEKDVLALIAPENIFDELASGLRRLKNRPLWYRRRFSYSCFKQRYHRRVWLKASLDLLVQDPVDGPMSHSDIGWILNRPKGTVGANLSRVWAALQARLNSSEGNKDLANLSITDIKEAKAKWLAELEPERLNAYVCDDLKPEVIQLSSKSSS